MLLLLITIGFQLNGEEWIHSKLRVCPAIQVCVCREVRTCW